MHADSALAHHLGSAAHRLVPAVLRCIASAAVLCGALVVAPGSAEAVSSAAFEPPCTDFTNLVFDLGVLAGEHDVLADPCFPAFGPLDWPPPMDPWGTTTAI